MELQFLNIGDYQVKGMWLQHINEMINIKLQEGDTYKILFEKIQERFTDDAVRLNAVNDWIQFNKDAQDDESVFEASLCNEDCYASFNLSK